jgi:hypothetical protein
MTLDEIIQLFEDVESGKEEQVIGFHLHRAIAQATRQTWHTNQDQPPTFSGFLKALKASEPPT